MPASGVGLEAQLNHYKFLTPPISPLYLLHRFPPLKSSRERTGGPSGPSAITISISSLQQDPRLGTCLSPSPAVGLPVPPVLQPCGLACSSCSQCLLRGVVSAWLIIAQRRWRWCQSLQLCGCCLQTVPTCDWCTSLPVCPFQGTGRGHPAQLLRGLIAKGKLGSLGLRQALDASESFAGHLVQGGGRGNTSGQS